VPVSTNRANNGDPPSDQNFEDIDIAEEELIDAYVRDELPVDERRLLEKGLRSSPQLVERLHFARLLADASDRAAELPPSPQPWWRLFRLSWEQRPVFNLAFAASVLIIFIGGAGLLAGWIKLRRESQQLTEQQAAIEQQRLELKKSAAEQLSATDQIRVRLREEQQRREADQQLIAELRQAQNQKPTALSATIATFFLLPISRGSEKEKELRPPAGKSRIRLQLAVDSIDYRGFLVEVRNSQDKKIFQQKVRSPRSGKLVTVTVSTQVLHRGAYSLQLSGISSSGTPELVSNYSFRIVPPRSKRKPLSFTLFRF